MPEEQRRPPAEASANFVGQTASADGSFDYEQALRACAAGERDALRSIYERDAGWLIAIAYRIVRQRALANDAVHDAFLQIWRKASTFDPARGSARGWIYSVVRNRARSMIRDHRREEPVDDSYLDALPGRELDPLEALTAASEASELARCLGQLDERQRRCIMLAYLDGYSHQQLALRLETPLGTVKSWIRRGLAALRKCLS